MSVPSFEKWANEVEADKQRKMFRFVAWVANNSSDKWIILPNGRTKSVHKAFKHWLQNERKP